MSRGDDRPPAIEAPLTLDRWKCRTRGSIVVEKVKHGFGAFGFNAATEVYEDLVEGGVIDPATWGSRPSITAPKEFRPILASPSRQTTPR